MNNESTAINYLDFSGLLNVGSSDFLIRDNELTMCKNCMSYQHGIIEKVPGYEKEDLNQLVSTQDVDFAHYYYDTANFDKYLIFGSKNSTNDGYNLKYITNLGSTTSSGYKTFTDDSSMNVNSIISATNYLGKMFFAGFAGETRAYIDAVGLNTINGTTMARSSSGDTDLTDSPNGRYIVRYRDLIYLLDASDGTDHYPNRAYYCDTPVAGAITWDNTVNFIDIGQDDGDEITGGAEAFDRLVLFKNNSMWVYDEISVKRLASVGCIEHRTIAKVGSNLYWFDGEDIYMWDSGYPKKISNKIKPILDKIDRSNYNSRLERPKKVFASVYENEYRLYIGTLTYNSIKYENTTVCYNTENDTFYLRCTRDKPSSFASFLSDKNKRRLCFGSEDGYSYTFSHVSDDVYSDDSDEIESHFETKNIDLGFPDRKKFNGSAVFYTENPQGLNVRISVDGKDDYTGSSFAILDKTIEKETMNDTFNMFKMKISENGKNKPWKFKGFTIDSKIIEEI